MFIEKCENAEENSEIIMFYNNFQKNLLDYENFTKDHDTEY